MDERETDPCFSDPRGWPHTVPGYAELPEHLQRAVLTAPALAPDDPAVPMLRGWLWGDPRPAAVPAMRPAA